MSLLDPATGIGGAGGAAADKKEKAAGMLESLMVKQILQASGAFKGQGGTIHNELFVDAIADAVAKGGGLGIGKLLDGKSVTGSSPLSSGPGTAASGNTCGTGTAASGNTCGTGTAASGNTCGTGAALNAVAALPQVVEGGARLTSNFGQRSDPFDGKAALHHGLDLAAAEGTPVLAAEAGVVKSVGERGGYGLAVEVEHAGGVTTLYGHSSETLVQVGDQIEKGQTIARVGHSGRATGDHLHFEVRLRGGAVDPRTALKAYAKSVDTLSKGL